MKLNFSITDASLEGGEESDGEINTNVDSRTIKLQIELLLMMMTEFQSKLKVDTVFELTVQILSNVDNIGPNFDSKNEIGGWCGKSHQIYR